jgi:hypothetical protein
MNAAEGFFGGGGAASHVRKGDSLRAIQNLRNKRYLSFRINGIGAAA